MSNQLFAERYWVGAKEDWTGNQKMCSMHDMCRYNMYVLSMCMATHLLISAAPHKHTHTRGCMHMHEHANARGTAMWKGLDLEAGGPVWLCPRLCTSLGFCFPPL